MKMTMQATRTAVDRLPPRRGCRWTAAFGAAVLAACAVAAAPRAALGQAADRVNLLTGPGISGKVLSVSPATVDVEGANGETQKISVETIREVQFGAEPQTLRMPGRCCCVAGGPMPSTRSARSRPVNSTARSRWCSPRSSS